MGCSGLPFKARLVLGDQVFAIEVSSTAACPRNGHPTGLQGLESLSERDHCVGHVIKGVSQMSDRQARKHSQKPQISVERICELTETFRANKNPIGPKCVTQTTADTSLSTGDHRVGLYFFDNLDDWQVTNQQKSGDADVCRAQSSASAQRTP